MSDSTLALNKSYFLLPLIIGSSGKFAYTKAAE